MHFFVRAALVGSTLFAASAAHAAGDSRCHFHGYTPAKESVITGCAVEHKDSLVSTGKIEPSWKTVKLTKAETVEGKKMKEWKVTFTNPNAKDASKQTLYMFFTLPGNLIAANFTGQ